jgi:tryptophan synthase alpha chain
MSNRLKEVFKKSDQKLLSVFYTAGFPSPESTVDIARHLEKAGADIIEIGIPFSDPIADGPVIQASNKVALDQGITLAKILEQVKIIRLEVTIPIVLMGYLNPVMQYGLERFIADAASAGVDGIILPDLPIDEFLADYQALTQKHNLTVTFLISPTTSPERIRAIDEASSGFIYVVSSSSTTGVKGDFSDEQEHYFRRIQEMQLHNPILVGFGVSDRNTFQKASRYAHGAIVGSSFINTLRESQQLELDIQKFVNEIKGAL